MSLLSGKTALVFGVANERPANQPGLVLQVLRNNADLGAAEETVVFPNDGPPLDDTMGSNNRARSDLDVGSDDREGLDFHVVGQFGLRVNNRGSVNFHFEAPWKGARKTRY